MFASKPRRHRFADNLADGQTLAWLAGRTSGLFIAALATATRTVGDIASGRDHSFCWIPWANGVTRFVTYGIVVALADQVRVQLSQAQELSIRDPLTGLINRHTLLNFGTREVDRSRRYAHSLAVVFHRPGQLQATQR